MVVLTLRNWLVFITVITVLCMASMHTLLNDSSLLFLGVVPDSSRDFKLPLRASKKMRHALDTYVHLPSHTFVDHQSEMFLCAPPFSGFESWSHHFASKRPHVKLLSEETSEKQEEILGNYLGVMMVREPLSRQLSTYTHTVRMASVDQYAASELHRIGRDPATFDESSYVNAELPSFLEISRRVGRLPHEEWPLPWTRQVDVCATRDIQYDMLVHWHRRSIDVRTVAKLVNWDNVDELPFQLGRNSYDSAINEDERAQYCLKSIFSRQTLCAAIMHARQRQAPAHDIDARISDTFGDGGSIANDEFSDVESALDAEAVQNTYGADVHLMMHVLRMYVGDAHLAGRLPAWVADRFVDQSFEALDGRHRRQNEPNNNNNDNGVSQHMDDDDDVDDDFDEAYVHPMPADDVRAPKDSCFANNAYAHKDAKEVHFFASKKGPQAIPFCGFLPLCKLDSMLQPVFIDKPLSAHVDDDAAVHMVLSFVWDANIEQRYKMEKSSESKMKSAKSSGVDDDEYEYDTKEAKTDAQQRDKAVDVDALLDNHNVIRHMTDVERNLTLRLLSTIVRESLSVAPFTSPVSVCNGKHTLQLVGAEITSDRSRRHARIWLEAIVDGKPSFADVVVRSEKNEDYCVLKRNFKRKRVVFVAVVRGQLEWLRCLLRNMNFLATQYENTVVQVSVLLVYLYSRPDELFNFDSIVDAALEQNSGLEIAKLALLRKNDEFARARALHFACTSAYVQSSDILVLVGLQHDVPANLVAAAVKHAIAGVSVYVPTVSRLAQGDSLKHWTRGLQTLQDDASIIAISAGDYANIGGHRAIPQYHNDTSKTSELTDWSFLRLVFEHGLRVHRDVSPRLVHYEP